MTRLDEVLQYLEENLDLEHIDSVKVRLKKALNYEKVDRIPVKIGVSPNRFKGYTYPEIYGDMEKMMINELIGVCGRVEVKDDGLPMIRANYGVGTFPSLFGLKCRVVNNNLPWIEHVDSIDQIKKILDKGIPDVRTGLGAKDFNTHEYYHEQLSKYPKCKEAIPIYHPDLQGPFDVAHLIWGSDIYYALYDEPDTVHALMKLVTQTYIKFMTELKKTIDDEDNGFNYHWGTLYKGRVTLRDDSPVNLSRDMYEEFVKPYDEQILKEFNGGSIHYCGRADQWVFSMIECEGIGGLNFGQPPKIVFGFEFLNKVYDRAKQNKVAITGYGMSKDLIMALKDSKFTTGVTFQTEALDSNEAVKILNSTMLV